MNQNQPQTHNQTANPVRAEKMSPNQLAHVQLIRTRARTVPNKKREAARRAARKNSAGRRSE